MLLPQPLLCTAGPRCKRWPCGCSAQGCAVPLHAPSTHGRYTLPLQQLHELILLSPQLLQHLLLLPLLSTTLAPLQALQLDLRRHGYEGARCLLVLLLVVVVVGWWWW